MSAPMDMGPAEFQAWTGVSRETLSRLTIYAEHLTQWQKRLNLVGPKTLPILWQRHMLDSAQLFPLMPPGCQVLADLGSGAGFPGLVLAAMGVPKVIVVESDSRKAVFLRETARAMDVAVTVHNRRIEALDGFPADVVTARALAPLSVLVDMSHRFTHKGTVLIFPKGKDRRREVAEATESWTKRGWTIDVQSIPSQTDGSAAIILMSGLPAAFDRPAAPDGAAPDGEVMPSTQAATFGKQ